MERVADLLMLGSLAGYFLVVLGIAVVLFVMIYDWKRAMTDWRHASVVFQSPRGARLRCNGGSNGLICLLRPAQSVSTGAPFIDPCCPRFL